ncbi:MAG: class I SAM-dependent methyltransferase [Myxococcota bacterium]
MSDWFTDEGFWERVYPVMFSPDRFEGAAAETQQLLALSGVRTGRALDLCCGPGRHAVPLARAGLQVVGVDLSETLLGKARARAAEAGVTIDWVCKDMREFVEPGAFDLVVNLSTSFGYSDVQADDMKALKNMVESIHDEGVIVLDMVGKEALAERLPLNRQPTREHDGSLLIQRVEVFDDWGRVRTEWLLIRGQQVQRFDFEHTLYSGHELRELMNWAGLSDVTLYGDLDGRPYGPGAERLVAVGRK